MKTLVAVAAAVVGFALGYLLRARGARRRAARHGNP